MDDNTIEWYAGEQIASVTFTQKKYINRIKKLAQTHKDGVEIIAENDDGSIFAHVPVDWIKINPPRQLSDEQKKEMSERMKRVRNS